MMVILATFDGRVVEKERVRAPARERGRREGNMWIASFDEKRVRSAVLESSKREALDVMIPIWRKMPRKMV